MIVVNTDRPTSESGMVIMVNTDTNVSQVPEIRISGAECVCVWGGGGGHCIFHTLRETCDDPFPVTFSPSPPVIPLKRTSGREPEQFTAVIM